MPIMPLWFRNDLVHRNSRPSFGSQQVGTEGPARHQATYTRYSETAMLSVLDMALTACMPTPWNHQAFGHFAPGSSVHVCRQRERGSEIACLFGAPWCTMVHLVTGRLSPDITCEFFVTTQLMGFGGRRRTDTGTPTRSTNLHLMGVPFRFFLFSGIGGRTNSCTIILFTI